MTTGHLSTLRLPPTEILLSRNLMYRGVVVARLSPSPCFQPLGERTPGTSQRENLGPRGAWRQDSLWVAFPENRQVRRPSPLLAAQQQPSKVCQGQARRWADPQNQGPHVGQGLSQDNHRQFLVPLNLVPKSPLVKSSPKGASLPVLLEMRAHPG